LDGLETRLPDGDGAKSVLLKDVEDFLADEGLRGIDSVFALSSSSSFALAPLNNELSPGGILEMEPSGDGVKLFPLAKR
jgi:hypothetical protein